jgi:hypothetical protein
MIRFEDNAEADTFVEAVRAHRTFHGKLVTPTEEETAQGIGDGFSYADTNAEAIAMWADPTKMCECHPPWKLPNPMHKEQGLQCNPARSAKFGWLVCTNVVDGKVCAKPHPHQFQHPKNLLNPDETSQTRLYCLGFRADRKAGA